MWFSGGITIAARPGGAVGCHVALLQRFFLGAFREPTLNLRGPEPVVATKSPDGVALNRRRGYRAFGRCRALLRYLVATV